MSDNERTIDLTHVFNYVMYNLKRIIMIALAVTIVVTILLVGKNIISPSDELYYSTAKVLFKFNSWSTTEKQYNFEDWNLVGSENLINESNNSFMTNCKNVFMSDSILLDVMDDYDINGELNGFKRNIDVTPIKGTDIVCLTVKASSPDLAEQVLGTVLSKGLNAAEKMYELKYEIIDKYTNSEQAYSKITVSDEGTIETSTTLMNNIKIIVISFVIVLAMTVLYYVMKCILNNKVESVELIEKEFKVPVLQAVKLNCTNYDIASTKIINSHVKSVIFTSIKKEELIGSDIVAIAKKLIERNKKVLIVCW